MRTLRATDEYTQITDRQRHSDHIIIHITGMSPNAMTL